MSWIDSLMENTAIYSGWQAPFAKQKFAPILKNNNLKEVHRVLDVGCGPGTNAPYFADADYLGVDINAKYVASARKKYKRNFQVTDVTTYEDRFAGKFDFILSNSFLHHISEPDCHKILSRLQGWLTADGHLHILELISPGDKSVAQFLANADRGKFVRPITEWREMFDRHLEVDIFEPYPLQAMGITLWNMVYCRGRAKT